MSNHRSQREQIPDELIAGINPSLPDLITKTETALAEGATAHDVLSSLAVSAYFAGYVDNANNTRSINKRFGAMQNLYGSALRFAREVEEAITSAKEA